MNENASLSVLVTMILWRISPPTPQELAHSPLMVTCCIQSESRKKKYVVVKSNSLQGATGKLFIKKTCPVKYVVILTILTTCFRMKNAHSITMG